MNSGLMERLRMVAGLLDNGADRHHHVHFSTWYDFETSNNAAAPPVARTRE